MFDLENRRTDRSGRLSEGLELLLCIGVLLYAANTCARLLRWVLAAQELPQWDMAKHGLAGLSLAQAMRQFDLVEFVTELNAMSTWPPAFPLLEAPFFLLFGDDYATPRCLVSVIHVVLIVAAIWAGWSVFPRRGLAVGGLTGMLLAVSPMVLVYSALVMLEVPGTTLLLLALASYLAAIDQPSKLRWRLAFLSATTLFFCKYNYGLI